MEAAVYQRMAAQEDDHWWHVGRRAVIGGLLANLDLESDSPRLLEIGCGTGGNLALLRQFGSVDAVEFDAAARHMATSKSGLTIGHCELPHTIDAPAATYDVVALLDVLEHVDDDLRSLQGAAARAKPGGIVLITVPAHPWLWSAHDDHHHHRRRYTRRDLVRLIGAAGLEVADIGWFNSLLFPAAVAQRLLKRLNGRSTPDDRMPPVSVNQVLDWLFRLERRLARRIAMPIGLSLYAVARRPRHGL